MKIKWYRGEVKPVTTIDFSEKASDEFGWNYGGQINYLTPQQLEDLKAGKMLAFNVNGGEYSQFLVLQPISKDIPSE